MTEKELEQLAQRISDLVTEKMSKLQEQWDEEFMQDLASINGEEIDVKVLGPADWMNWETLILESIAIDETDLKIAVDEEDFERATKLRDNIKKLKETLEKYRNKK